MAASGYNPSTMSCVFLAGGAGAGGRAGLRFGCQSKLLFLWLGSTTRSHHLCCPGPGSEKQE